MRKNAEEMVKELRKINVKTNTLVAEIQSHLRNSTKIQGEKKEAKRIR